MVEREYGGKGCAQALNEWHLELAMVGDVVAHLLREGNGPEWWSSAGHIVSERLRELVESFPFPGGGEGSEGGDALTAELH